MSFWAASNGSFQILCPIILGVQWLVAYSIVEVQSLVSCPPRPICIVCSSMKSTAVSCFPVSREEVFHPDSLFSFPKRAFGKTNPNTRACQAKYFKTCPCWPMMLRKTLPATCAWTGCKQRKWQPREPTHHSRREGLHTGRMQRSLSKSMSHLNGWFQIISTKDFTWPSQNWTKLDV